MVDNGFMEVYVNTKVNDGSDVAELMAVFSQKDTYNDKFPIASSKKRFFNSESQEVEKMSGIIQELIERERADAAKTAVIEGSRQNAFTVAKNMKENGLSCDMIVKCTGLSKEDLNNL